jgi:hypothetical protein
MPALRRYRRGRFASTGRAIAAAWDLEPGPLPPLRVERDNRRMTKYLISFPGSQMQVPEAEFASVGEAARAVIREAKDAGVYVFAGGIDESVAPLRVSADASMSSDIYAEVVPDGGYAILELPSYEDAVAWAAKLATACRCDQEVRAFAYDPES